MSSLFQKLKNYVEKYMNNCTQRQKMTKDDVVALILKECKNQGVTDERQIKYILATVEHETNDTFMPVKEAYWLSENWRKRNLRYY